MRIRGTALALAILGAGFFGAQVAATFGHQGWQMAPIATATAAEPEHDRYVKENEGRFEQWGRQIDEWNREARRRSEQATQKAERQLDRAWADAQKHWQALKEASSAGWDEAKDAYEKSLERLERVWDDVKT